MGRGFVGKGWGETQTRIARIAGPRQIMQSVELTIHAEVRVSGRDRALSAFREESSRSTTLSAQGVGRAGALRGTASRTATCAPTTLPAAARLSRLARTRRSSWRRALCCQHELRQ